MSALRKSIASTAAGCALCLGAVLPTALSTTIPTQGVMTPAAFTAPDGTVRDPGFAPSDEDWLPALLGASGALPPSTASTIVVITPGTDDNGLDARTRGLRGNRQTIWIDYPESFAPVITGRSGALLPVFAPAYDDSRDIAIAHNLLVMAALRDDPEHPFAVYTGYSQGADALGDAAEAAVAAGGIDTAHSVILLVSDPRSPWGLKAAVAAMPLLPYLAPLLGITVNGARDPGATGTDLPVTSVIVVGDPVANFQWIWYRPVSSLAVDAAGFITIHSAAGSQSYENLDELGEPQVLYSADGNTTYLVYTAHHPFTQLTEMIVNVVGVDLDEDDLDRLDALNSAFYEVQRPGVDNAAVPVTATAPSAARTASTSGSVAVADTSDTADPIETATGDDDTTPQASEPAAGSATGVDATPPADPTTEATVATESTGTESTGTESTGTESTGTEAPVVTSPEESTGTTDTESTDTESTDTESTDTPSAATDSAATDSGAAVDPIRIGRHRAPESSVADYVGRHRAPVGASATSAPRTVW
ncbi:MAG: PE-PPE domain-containing protein [Gordonia sp. (in: high G+C Gram-positive bacteria)]